MIYPSTSISFHHPTSKLGRQRPHIWWIHHYRSVFKFRIRIQQGTFHFNKIMLHIWDHSFFENLTWDFGQ